MKTTILAVAVAAALSACGGGGSSTTTLTCVNTGAGNQQCIDGDGNVTDSKCINVNGVLATLTGEPCDASESVPAPEPTPEPTAPAA